MKDPTNGIQNHNLPITSAQLAEFCRKWSLAEFALFGSAVREDFGPDSDFDVLVRFGADATPTLGGFVRMHDELAAMLGRDVDLVSRDAVERSKKALPQTRDPLFRESSVCGVKPRISKILWITPSASSHTPRYGAPGMVRGCAEGRCRHPLFRGDWRGREAHR